jgi:hypothetical protein
MLGRIDAIDEDIADIETQIEAKIALSLTRWPA